MVETNNGVISAEEILVGLTALPHRGVGTAHISEAAAFLKDTLERSGAAAETQPFDCPKTYLPLVWWLVGGVIFGLLLAGWSPWPALVVTAAFAVTAAVHFDWRPTPIYSLVPKVRAENIIARKKPRTDAGPVAAKKIILTAHYDTAPVSFVYRPSMVAGFRRSLLISIALMLLSPVLIFVQAAGATWWALTWLRYGLILYFAIQLFLSAIDYYRFGFSNGAADNASGVAVATATASRLWQEPKGGRDIELVLTSGEEVGMVGARAYLQKYRAEMHPDRVYLLNFDNLGSGKIKIISETGIITTVRYDNVLSKAAIQMARVDPRFSDVGTADWHTGDFDSIWFERAGISSLTLSALDEKALMPNLHRPEDTIDNVDMVLVNHAVDFAVAVIESLSENRSR